MHYPFISSSCVTLSPRMTAIHEISSFRNFPFFCNMKIQCVSSEQNFIFDHKKFEYFHWFGSFFCRSILTTSENITAATSRRTVNTEFAFRYYPYNATQLDVVQGYYDGILPESYTLMVEQMGSKPGKGPLVAGAAVDSGEGYSSASISHLAFFNEALLDQDIRNILIWIRGLPIVWV